MPSSVPFSSPEELHEDSMEVGLPFSSVHHPDHRDQHACTQAPSSHNSERQALSLFLLYKRGNGGRDSCTA